MDDCMDIDGPSYLKYRDRDTIISDTPLLGPSSPMLVDISSSPLLRKQAYQSYVQDHATTRNLPSLSDLDTQSHGHLPQQRTPLASAAHLAPTTSPAWTLRKREYQAYVEDDISTPTLPSLSDLDIPNKGALPQNTPSPRRRVPAAARVRFASPSSANSLRSRMDRYRAVSPRISPVIKRTPVRPAAPQPHVQPMRRITGNVTSIYSTLRGLFSHFWGYLTTSAGVQPAHEIIAVETNSSGNKRRAVEASQPPSPFILAIPGSFPESPVQLQTPPESQQGEPRHDSPMEMPEPSQPKVPAITVNEPVAPEEPTADTTEIEDYDFMPKVMPKLNLSRLPSVMARAEEEKKLALAEEASKKVSSTAGPAHLPPANAKAQRNADRDAAIDSLITKTRQVVLESPELKAFRESYRTRKRREQEALEEAQQRGIQLAEEEAAEAARLLAEEEAAIAAKLQAAKEAAEFEEAARQQLERETAEAEEARLRAEAELAVKHRLVLPLPAEWERKVAQAMAIKSKEHVIVKTVEGAELKRHDFGSLLPQERSGDNPNGWLNDEIVNGWMAAIVQRKCDQTGHKKGNTPPFATYSSAWFSNYQKGGITSIAGWSRRKGIKGESLLQSEKIYFPVNTGAHWLLLIISPKARTIEVLDSMNTSIRKRLFHAAREWLSMELASAYTADDWTEMASSSNQQKNMNDCGVFTCYNALASAKGRSYSEVHMDGARMIMGAILINGGFTGDWEL